MGATCLIFAVSFNKFEIARMLVEHGADLSAKDARGHTALFHARSQGLPEMEALLTEAG